MEAIYQTFDFSPLTKEDSSLLKHAAKLDQVREMLMETEQDSLQSLELVDTIQRLGLCHHFKDEIESILHQQYLAHTSNDSLLEASLRFRLLRQHGCRVIADDFFGHFLRSGELRLEDGLVGGVTRGLVAMHEASHLNTGGEEILREAAEVSSLWLNANRAVICLDDELERVVNFGLSFPQHKIVAGFTAKSYLQFVGDDNHVLRELAEFEFAYTESLHKHEILRVVEWWKRLGLREELKSSRNQPLKWHVWSMAILRNPMLSKHRIMLTKPISLVYVVDDIFDLYGTVDELTLFTHAVKRWDVCDELPSYMKTCLNAIYETTGEISSFVYREHGWNPSHFLKREWGSLMDAFLVEGKWLRNGEVVKAEEYLKNGVISSGVPMVLSHLFLLMGNPLSHQTQTLLTDPNGLTHSVAKLLRLLDDLGSAKDEEQIGFDGSYIEFYMKEGKAKSREEAREEVMNMVSETWENINKHGFSSTSSFSAGFRRACLNAARMVPTMYTYDEDHHLPLLRHHLQTMFADPAFAKALLS
ncbi:(3S,6E)-nerolidol synthase 1-like [Salvia splendens]|uniref:(3S,6E)-nerolidol synthase 1-like n=1 Tax=Salvia splendens TaxID=180675 RepID=UPI0011038108|nr:(3S,6E)-nerolidol synthase 1-like [Salvia splendens]